MPVAITGISPPLCFGSSRVARTFRYLFPVSLSHSPILFRAFRGFPLQSRCGKVPPTIVPSDLQEERRRKESFSVLLSHLLLVGCPAFYDRPTSPPRSRNKAGNREIPNFCVSDSSGQIFFRGGGPSCCSRCCCTEKFGDDDLTNVLLY